jgi:hypothetical protein
MAQSKSDPKSKPAPPAALPELLDFEAYQSEVAHLFPSVGALEWFWKRHKAELLRSGAVVIINRRKRVHAPTMAAVILQLAQRRAQDEAAREAA